MPTALKVAWIVLVLALASAGSIVTLTGSPKDVELYGVEYQAERPKWTAGGFVHEKFQPAATTWFEQHWGLRGYAVRTDNTINDELFQETRIGQGVVLGKRHVEFKDEDVTYLNRTDDSTGVIAAAARFAHVQRRLREVDTLLIPVILPSKTSIFRDDVPDAFKRRGGAGMSDETLYRAFVKALEANGAVFVDGRALLERASAGTEEGPLAVFPRTGRHWTLRPACRVMQAIADAARPYFAQLGTAQLDCTVAPRNRLDILDEEVDLQRLLNTWAPLPKDVAVYDLVGKKGGEPFRVPTLFMGSSFLWKMVLISRELQVFRPSLFYYYDKLIVETDPQAITGKVEPHSAAWRAQTWSKRLIVVDVLETYLPGAGQEFLDELESDLDRGRQ